MLLPFAHICETSQRTFSFQAEPAVVLHEKSSLLSLHRNNRASRAFLNVASFQNFLKMGKEVWFSLVSCISSIQTHLSEVLIYTEGDSAIHYLMITTLLDTGSPPEQCVWLLHISTLALSLPLLKPIWDANTESLCHTLYVYQTLKEKK